MMDEIGNTEVRKEIDDIQRLLQSDVERVEFQERIENELAVLEKQLESLFRELTLQVVQHFKAIALREEDKIAKQRKKGLKALKKRLTQLEEAQNKPRPPNHEMILVLLDSMKCEKERLMVPVTCYFSIKGTSVMEKMRSECIGNIVIEVEKNERSDEQRAQ